MQIVSRMHAGTDQEMFQDIQLTIKSRLQNKGTYPHPATGFTVATELRLTEDKGVGVFAAEFIPADTQVVDYTYWELDENQVHSLLTFLDRQSAKYFMSHAWNDWGRDRIHYTDYDIIMINHSTQPTLRDSDELTDYSETVEELSYTVRDLYPGDEFTENYHKCSFPQYFRNLGIQYGVSEEFF